MEERRTGSRTPPELSRSRARTRTLVVYRVSLDVIVSIMTFVMLITLLGAVTGVVIDLVAAAEALGSGVHEHKLGLVDSIDRELVIDVLSVFVLVELFRTFADYIEFHRVRLMVLAEVGIAFVLREVFIGLYERSMVWPEVLALSVLLAVLVGARVASITFLPTEKPPDNQAPPPPDEAHAREGGARRHPSTGSPR